MASPVSGISSSTAIQYPGQLNRAASAMGARPAPRPASQPRHCLIASGSTPAGGGTWSSGISVTDARHAAKEVAAVTSAARGGTTSIMHSV